ncbi:MAG: tetratricopeptide repeat protein [Massilia sp.]
MSPSKSPSRLITGLGLAAGLLVASGAFAQTAPATASAAAPPAATTQQESAASVTVNARRLKPLDPAEIFKYKSKFFSRNSAGSASFMRSYSPEYDDVVLQYARDFNLLDDDPNDYPYGSVKPDREPILGFRPFDENARDFVSNREAFFAAGQRSILRRDTTLAEGMQALDNKDYPNALRLFNAAYEKIGYDEAALMIGKLHLYGLGTPKDTGQAVFWFKRIAEARFDPSRDRFRFDPKAPAEMNERIEAAVILAKIYLFGIGTGKNQVEARHWYEKAADFGFIPASNTLGLAYLSGYGGEKNPGKAVALMKEASEAGYAPAQYQLGKLYYNGAESIPKDTNLGAAYLSAAARAGNDAALLAVARMYDRGEGVGVDQGKAIVYYKESATKGNPEAQNALATYFYSGEVVDKDLTTARRLLDASAKQGNPDAMFNLAVMSTKGEGGPKDVALAYVWLSLAKSSGFEKAGPALKVVTPMLSTQDQQKADAILNPRS